MSVETSRGCEAGLRIVDELTPTSRARPYGITAAEIYAKVGPEAPLSIADCTFKGIATRSRHAIRFDADEAGQRAYIIARWINAKGQAGPVSAAAMMMVAA